MSVVGPATAVDPIDALGAIGVIPVVVIDAAAQAAPLAEALMSGGINGVEVTLRTPDVGLIEFAREFRYGIGGAESNVAIGAARLGAQATWLGRLGSDATGDLIERRLRAEGSPAARGVDPSTLQHAVCGPDYRRASH